MNQQLLLFNPNPDMAELSTPSVALNESALAEDAKPIVTRVGTKTINGRAYNLDLVFVKGSEETFCQLDNGESWQLFLTRGDSLITLYDAGDGPWKEFDWYLDEFANGEVPAEVKSIAYELFYQSRKAAPGGLSP
jgi:hypothetical protein